MAGTIPQIRNQSIQGVTTTGGSQAATGTFYGDLHFSSVQSRGNESINACLDALFITNPEVDREELISSKGERATGTCEWVKDHELYLRWRRGDTRVLWIRGGPGKGKTMISIYLSQLLEKETIDDETIHLTYCFCTSGSERNNAAAVLRRLLWQILKKYPQLSKPIEDDFRSPEAAKATLFSRESLWLLLKKLAPHVNECSVLFLLDGLDECDDDSVRWLTNKFVQGCKTPDATLSYVRIIIVSRSISGLADCEQIRLDPDNDARIKSDIEIFATESVAQLSKNVVLDQQFIECIEKTLVARSQGTFLWIGYAMNELLQRRTGLEIEKTLEELPQELDAVYDRMITQISPRNKDQCLQLIMWVTLAVRPLSIPELAAALKTKHTANLSPDLVTRDLVAECGPLLQEHAETVVLVHQSAKDFLLRNNNSGYRVISPQLGHYKISEACLDCIEEHMHNERQPSMIGWPNVIDWRLAPTLPLLKYAMRNWATHLNGADDLSDEQFFDRHIFFQENSPARPHWWLAYEIFSEVRRDIFDDGKWLCPELNRLPMASLLGCQSWAESILRRRWTSVVLSNPANEHDSEGNTPLHYAAGGGHDAMVKLLVQHGAEVNAVNNQSQTPLWLAATGHHMTVVTSLTIAGAFLDQTVGHWTVLERAILYNDVSMARLLLELGATVDILDHMQSTLLMYAAAKGSYDVAEMLIEYGANVNHVDLRGESVLTQVLTFTLNERESTVELLVEHGAALTNAKQPCTDLLMHLAYGRESFVRFVLEYCIEPSAISEAKSVSPHCLRATTTEALSTEALVDVLLQHGAEIDASSTRDGYTPLHLAAMANNTSVARKLLSLGAKDSQIPYLGTTALQMAEERGHREIVQLLQATTTPTPITSND